MEPGLFAVYLGGRHENGFIEAHDLVFVVAETKDEAKKCAKMKTLLREDIHCDGIIELKNVDGWHIRLEKTDTPPSLIIDTQYQKL